MKKKLVVELTEFDIGLLLGLIGKGIQNANDSGKATKQYQILMSKFYRAMGVSL